MEILDLLNQNKTANFTIKLKENLYYEKSLNRCYIQTEEFCGCNSLLACSCKINEHCKRGSRVCEIPEIIEYLQNNKDIILMLEEVLLVEL